MFVYTVGIMELIGFLVVLGLLGATCVTGINGLFSVKTKKQGDLLVGILAGLLCFGPAIAGIIGVICLIVLALQSQ